MGDAAAAAAAAAASTSTSAPDTPTSILICREDGGDILADADDDDGGAGADLVVARDERLLAVDHDEEYVALLLSEESASGGGHGGGAPAEEMEDWMKAARSGCVRWIIKNTAAFRCGGKTAYVAVTYLDRFLAQRRVNRGQEWALKLLMVACLSLAIKTEEQHAPRLSEFRVVDGAHELFDFDSASILRMELLVLSTLEWRMTAATPFSFLSCFAARFRDDERRPILLRAVECVFAAIKAMSTAEYQPSTIAVASILVARGRGREETPAGNLDALKAILGSSCPHLDTGHVYSCYRAMVQEHDDKSPTPTRSTSTASGVSVAAHAGSGGSPGTGAASVSVGASNNAAGTATPADHSNKRRRLRSPQRQ